MALNLKDINKEKKKFPQKKDSDQIASQESSPKKQRPWKDFEREEDLLDVIYKKKYKKKFSDVLKLWDNNSTRQP